MNALHLDWKRKIRRLMPRGIHPHRILAGPLRGQWLVTSWHDYPGALLGYTERPLLEWLQRLVSPTSTWIDVGAHYGYTALALSNLVGRRGRVFAFEPVLSTAGHLSRTRYLNHLQHLTVVPLGLGAHRELQPADVPLVRGMAEHVAGAATTGTERIFAVAFDDVWPGLSGGKSRIDGVKIDVQGMEIDVLTGMRETLLTSKPIVILEFHRGVDRSALLDLLSGLGYGGTGEPIGFKVNRRDDGYGDDESYIFLGGRSSR